MQGEEKPEADPSDDVDDEDDDINDDNVKSIQLSTEAVRSKSEQDLARTHSLDLLTVGYWNLAINHVINREHTWWWW